jgi:glycosyltransferase involved in cell wall biosynthesis
MQPHRSLPSYHAISAQNDVQPAGGNAPVERAGKPLLTQSLSVVLPAHNEEANIAGTVSQTIHTLQQWVQELEIIVVNDGSTDETGSILASLQQQDTRIRVVTHPVNQGYGAALASGFEAASKELVFFMDSDGQFDITDIQSFFLYIKNYDAVIGYRVKRQDSAMRKLNAWGWKMLVGLILGVHVRDVDCAFKLYHADFLHRHRLETTGAMINAELLYKLKQDGGTIKEIGVRHLPRRAGQATGANIKVILRAFLELWIYARRWKREEHQR